MNPVDNFLIGYALLITTISFIHLVRVDAWWIRIWDFPHLQLTVLAAVGLLGWVALSRNTEWPMLLAVAGLVAALVYEGWLIYPFTPLHRKEVSYFPKSKRDESSELNRIRILNANVFMENTKCPDVMALVEKHNPDVLMILEANLRWQKALEPLESQFPYRILYPLENTYGLLFYSSLPIRHQEVRFLIQDDIPSIYAQLQLKSGQLVHFYGIHPMPPSPTEHYRSTERDAELLVVGKEVRTMKEPVIVAGDLNDVAWSHSTRLFQRISGLFDPRIGRGLYNTFHAKYFFLRWPLDHIFVSHHFRLRSIKRLPNCGSDHFPILISLAYAPEAVARAVPQPEKDDLKETEEIIERAEE
ncbi:endonuclease/exonuclease/phosphatase family protein [Larkinella rosea]|uniref:Endonuclease n=1 Tax=Larkinella rosea TaxID=2025312 RepID=A0A3P1C1J6_9BACT|nr:endonuclease/exonuclease/phosphatase family protein [Larkinella rosea]RRB06644.1 endonuclease [Larkinella rosea]